MTTPTHRPGWRERAFVGLQYLLPQHFLSRLVRRATRSTYRPWKDFLIRSFLRGFPVDLEEAIEPDPYAYPTFNDFFTRALKAQARPIVADPRAIASPVDGTVSQSGTIDDALLVQAKGHRYSVEALLAGDRELARCFRGGEFATLYLAPYNYHRVHMPLSGRLSSVTLVPGRLFSVNEAAARNVPELFARNERIVCEFATDAGRFVLVLVGALFVGSMSTVWADEMMIHHRRAPTRLGPPANVVLERGQEMGRFNMGSTVILLHEPQRARWSDSLLPGARVRMGERIGDLLSLRPGSSVATAAGMQRV